MLVRATGVIFEFTWIRSARVRGMHRAAPGPAGR